MEFIDSDVLRVVLGIGVPVIAVALVIGLFLLIDTLQSAKEFFERENRIARMDDTGDD